MAERYGIGAAGARYGPRFRRARAWKRARPARLHQSCSAARFHAREATEIRGPSDRAHGTALAVTAVMPILVWKRGQVIQLSAGVTVQEVNRLLNQFEQTQKMMKMMAKGGIAKMMRNMKGMFPGMR